MLSKAVLNESDDEQAYQVKETIDLLHPYTKLFKGPLTAEVTNNTIYSDSLASRI